MRICTVCKKDISHKTSNNASKCDKCVRAPNQKSLQKIKARTQNMRPVKMEVLTAYGASCAICGWSIKGVNPIHKGRYQHQRGCEIHHIHPVSEGGQDVFDNCVLLCPNHHKEADLGIISKSDLLQYVIKNKDEAISIGIEKHLSDAADLLEDMF